MSADQRDTVKKVRDAAFEGQIPFCRADAGNVLGKVAHVGRNRHFVLVQNDDQPKPAVAIVQRLIDHAAGERAVPDHRDGKSIRAAKTVGFGKAERSRDRCAAVSRAEAVAFALRTLCKARKPVFAPQGGKAFLSSR